MRTISTSFFVAAAIFFIAAPGHSQDKKTPAKEDPKLTAAWKELEGRWAQVGIDSGDFYSDLSDEPVVFAITRKGISYRGKGEIVDKPSPERFEIDPTVKPAHLNLILQPKNLRPSVCINWNLP